jgi:hypothetical protein
MMRQAVTINVQALVGTGLERQVASDSRELTLKEMEL